MFPTCYAYIILNILVYVQYILVVNCCKLSAGENFSLVNFLSDFGGKFLTMPFLYNIPEIIHHMILFLLIIDNQNCLVSRKHKTIQKYNSIYYISSHLINIKHLYKLHTFS